MKKSSIKKKIIRPKKQSSLKWYFIGAIIAAFALALGHEAGKKGVDKVEAYLAKRHMK
jgi:hypothetical protein